MKKTIIIAAAISMMICSCNNKSNDPIVVSENSKLKVNVSAGPETRGLIETTALEDGSEVSVTILEDGNASYDGIDTYKNVRYTAATSGSVQAWNADTDIYLSTTMGTLYSYYPYSGSVTDITKVPVTATTANQTDYMYGTPVSGLNNKTSEADIVMNHALAAIRLSIVKGTFSGTGQITSVSVNGEAIATGAQMDAMTGVLSGFSGQDTRIAPAFTAFSLSSTPEVKDFIIIPTGESKPMTIAIEVDGFEITAKTPAADFAEGTIANYSVKVNSQKLVVSSVSVTPWGESDKGEIEIL